MRHTERHRAQRVGWLCAAVLGANDGIVSTASLIVAVAAAEASRSSVLSETSLRAGFGLRLESGKWSEGGEHRITKPERNARRRAADGSPPLLRHIANARS